MSKAGARRWGRKLPTETRCPGHLLSTARLSVQHGGRGTEESAPGEHKRQGGRMEAQPAVSILIFVLLLLLLLLPGRT
eukprot:4972657-Pyramimonas_sp.AAC.1